MKNNIMYYYNLRIDNITQNNNNYYFTINNDNYCFTIYTRDIKESDAIYKLNKYMLSSNILVHEIIPNKDNYVVTIINNIPYILYKIYINKNKKLTINELTYLSNYTYQVDKILTRNNWNILWSNKIDYFEYQINQMGKKYPILVDTFAYFTGLAENAISYVKYTTLETQIETSDNASSYLFFSYALFADFFRSDTISSTNSFVIITASLPPFFILSIFNPHIIKI